MHSGCGLSGNGGCDSEVAHKFESMAHDEGPEVPS